MMRKMLLFFAMFFISIGFCTDFGKFVSKESPTIEDLSEYIKVINVDQNLDKNITYVHIQNTYTSDIFAENLIINNITIPYEIKNVSIYYNGNTTPIEKDTYQNLTFEIDNILIPIGESIIIISNNLTSYKVTTNNVYVLPEDKNFTANINESYNFTFTIDSYTLENYTVNITVLKDDTVIYNKTNINVTNYSYEFTVENISFNTYGNHTIEINVSTNVSEYTYADNLRVYHIEVQKNETNNPPNIIIYSPENKTYDSNKVLVNFSIYDYDLYIAYWKLIYNRTISLYQNNTYKNINFSKEYNLPNGKYTLKVSAIDMNNNIKTKEINFIVNKIEETPSSNSPPEIDILQPKVNETYNTTNISVKANIFDPDNNLNYTIINIINENGDVVYLNKVYKIYNITQNVNLNKTGKYILKILSVDTKGAKDYKETIFYMNLSKKTKEKLKIYINNNTVINATYYNTTYEIFDFDSTKSYKIIFKIDNETRQIFTVNENIGPLVLNFENVSNGGRLLEFDLIWNNQTLDKAFKNVILNISAYLKNEPPKIEIFDPLINQSQVIISYNISDENLNYANVYILDKYGTVYYLFTENSSGYFQHKINLSYGNYTIFIDAVDEVGAKSNASLNFTVFSTNVSPPIVYISYPKQNQTISTSKIYVNFTVIDPNIKSVYVYLIDENGFIQTAYHYNISGTFYLPIALEKEGKYTIKVYAENIFGKYNSSSVDINNVINQTYNSKIKIIEPTYSQTYTSNLIKIKFNIENYDSNNKYYVLATFIGNDQTKIIKKFDNVYEDNTKSVSLPVKNNTYILKLSLYTNGKYTDQDTTLFNVKIQTIEEINIPLIKIYNPTNKTYITTYIPIYFEVISNKTAYNHFVLLDKNETKVSEKYEHGTYWLYKDLSKLQYNKTYILLVESYDGDSVITKNVTFTVKYVNYWVDKIEQENNKIKIILCTNKLNETLDYDIFSGNYLIRSENVSMDKYCKEIYLNETICGKVDIKADIKTLDSYELDNTKIETLDIDCSVSVFKRGGTSYETPENPLYVFIILVMGIIYLIARSKDRIN